MSFLSIIVRDGGLGFIPTEAQGLAVIAVAAAGPTLQLQSITDPKQAYTTFTSGKLPDRAAHHFGAGGPGPLYLMRPVASTAGAIPSYQETLSAALAGNAAGNAFTISAQPSVARNVEVTFGAGYDGGNVTVVGTAEDDSAQTEIITAAAGTTVKGLLVFKTVASATKGAVGANAATARIYTGNKSTAGSSATTAKLAVSGTPLDDYEIVVQVTRAGDASAAGCAARYSFDGGDTWTAERAIPAGAAYTGFATSHGLTFTFTGNALKVDDEFAQLATGPQMTSSDLGDALAALHEDDAIWEGLHICGALTGSIAAAVEAWHATCLADGRAAFTIIEARDFTAAEQAAELTDGTGNATWQTSVKADYASVLSTIGQLSAVPDYVETLIPNKGIFRRNGAWATATKIVSVPISTHPGAPVEAGPLRGVGARLYQDERKKPGMGGSTGRFMTLQTHIGLPGQFFIGDGQGLRDGGTLAAGDSDYSLIPYVRLILKTYRLMQVMGTRLLLIRLACKRSGALLESQAKKLDADVTAYLKTYLQDEGDCVSVRAVMNRSYNVLSNKKLPFSVFILPYGYAAEVEATLGFERVLAAAA